ncbi:hypothetical protein DICVIV_04158 [Dictyocaulus viviparus]|uniref:Major facilitator superfamily (MFS) profile domain-containing protein n=1 Tax=Dictyocaulus viviparus TaxID=29172 RepID=A0A0D8Y555_DICVI|nr:hypothetical protein DICVIV_04158 [Dictyocaulus viviparus]
MYVVEPNLSLHILHYAKKHRRIALCRRENRVIRNHVELPLLDKTDPASRIQAYGRMTRIHTLVSHRPSNLLNCEMENITLCSITGIRLFIIGCILTSITNFPAAFTHTSVNSAVLKIEEYLNNSFSGRFRPLETHEISLIKSGINTIWYVGQVVGAFLSPYICDNWGRKPAYVISTVVMAAACGMQMIASLTSFAEIFVIGRVITSVFSPLSDAALILYLQEISPSSYRGTMSSLFSTGYAIMCLIGMLLGHEDILGKATSYSGNTQ